MKIGINALGLQPSHRGGAESVFLNLVKGFNNIGYSDKIIYFCYPQMADVVRERSAKSEIVIVRDIINDKHARISACIVQTFVFHRIYKKYDLDIVFFVNAEVGLLKYKIPSVVIPHDIQNVARPQINKNKLQYYLNYFSYKNTFLKVDKIIAISDEDKNDITRCFPFSERKVVKIYNPIDVRASEVEIIKRKQDYILAVNIQYAHKNTETLICAFKKLILKYPKFKLKLAGAKNDYTEKLEELVNKLGLSDKVDFLGFITKAELENLWSRTSLYVNPSLFEGFGMTSVESMIYGAPTLLSDLDVNREVTDNLCTYFNDLLNADKLAKEMKNMLEQKYDKKFYKKRAYKISQKYDVNEIGKQYIELFLTMLE